jgi:tRNA G26 N,N-dimethylase Trm1
MGAVEVFRTNVETEEQAQRLAHLIHENFPEYSVNFDLNDCDRILRVKSTSLIRESSLVALLHNSGFDAAILADEIPPFIGNAAILSI